MSDPRPAPLHRSCAASHSGGRWRRARWLLLRSFLLIAIIWPLVQGFELRRGRSWLAEPGVAAAQQWTRGHVESCLLGALEIATDFVDSLGVDPPDSTGLSTVRCRVRASLADLDVLMSAALERAGLRVRPGTRRVVEGGETLEMIVGTDRQFTHRLIATRGRPRVVLPPLPRGRLALVIDDFGHNFDALTRRVLSIDAPLTIAILPELRHSTRVLEEAQRRGKQTLLHMPMEPDEGAPVGPGEPCVRVGMAEMEVRAAVERALDALPGVQGLNNHMGSRATRYRPEMRAALDVVAERGLVFLDSQTSSGSVAADVAQELEIPSLRNDLFLDVDTEDPEVVWERLQQLLERARRRGWAVGIGHVNHATVEGIERLLSELEPQDVQLVGLIELIEGQLPRP